jgi:hypothetical protein
VPEVEAQNRLGIHLGKDGATVVCVGSQGRDVGVVGCFSVALEKQREADFSADMSELARLIADGCDQRNLHFAEAAIALDCAMFMQHDVHSEFKDPKQIAQTVRFDTEEALSTDVSDVAVAFGITSTDETGSQLDVFTAQRQILSAILSALQSNNIDPITIDPDVNCLARFIRQNITEPEDSNPLFAVLSQRSGYCIGPAREQTAPFVRTFLVDQTSDRVGLLARQIPITVALIGTGQSVNCLRIFGLAEPANVEQLGQRLGLETTSVDLVQSAGTDPGLLADCHDTVDFAIACGAGLAHCERGPISDFRNDFMPYQGRKRRMEKALMLLSIFVTAVVIALGMYVTPQLLRMHKYRSRLWGKFKPQYSAVMLGQRPLKGFKLAVGKLERAERGLQKGTTGKRDTVSAKLVSILQAFNKCAKRTKLNVDSIMITSRSIKIIGDTSKHTNTLKVRDAIRKKKLGTLTEQLKSIKSGRHTFTFTITEPGKKRARR